MPGFQRLRCPNKGSSLAPNHQIRDSATCGLLSILVYHQPAVNDNYRLCRDWWELAEFTVKRKPCKIIQVARPAACDFTQNVVCGGRKINLRVSPSGILWNPALFIQN